MKDIGEESYMIGIEIFCDRSQRLLRLYQKGYLKIFQERFNMNNVGTLGMHHIVRE